VGVIVTVTPTCPRCRQRPGDYLWCGQRNTHGCQRCPKSVQLRRSVRTLDTYRYDATKFAKLIAGVRVGEASPARIDAALRSMRTTHGPTMARRARTLLRGALQLAVLNNVLGTNPVRDVQSIRSKAAPKGASALTAEEVPDLLTKLRASQACQQRDPSLITANTV
jgi:site-specific recombinase XerD